MKATFHPATIPSTTRRICHLPRILATTCSGAKGLSGCAVLTSYLIKIPFCIANALAILCKGSCKRILSSFMALSKCTSVVNDDCDDVGVVVGCEVGAGSDSKNRNRLRHARANTGHAIADGGGSGGIAPNWPRSADRPELIGHFVGIRAGIGAGRPNFRCVLSFAARPFPPAPVFWGRC